MIHSETERSEFLFEKQEIIFFENSVQADIKTVDGNSFNEKMEPKKVFFAEQCLTGQYGPDIPVEH